MRTIIVVVALLCLTQTANAWELFKSDDTICREMGARPGTPWYLKCRLIQQLRRDNALYSIGRSNIRPSVNCSYLEYGEGYYMVDCD